MESPGDAATDLHFLSEPQPDRAGASPPGRGEAPVNSGPRSHMRGLAIVRSAVFVFCGSWLTAQAPPDILIRSTQAIGYEPGGATSIGFKGTDPMPHAAGAATVN